MEATIKERTMKFIKYKGLSMKEFEQRCDLSTGYVTSMRKGFGSDKLNNVLTSFPELNRDWLLYGEGEMLKPQPSVTQIAGDNNSNVNINGTPNAFDALLKVVETYQEQINRLITIIEKKL